jgi:hypothetical protein
VSKQANLKALLLAVPAVVVALSVIACGGDDEKSASATTSTQTETGQDGTAGSGAGKRGGGSSGGASTDEGTDKGSSGAGRSGGAGAPRVDRPLRRRTLARYLAERYRQTAWYGTIKRIGVHGSKVRVYTSLDPESDDEAPPLLACEAVRDYSTRIEKVTVLGSTEKLVPTKVLRDC